MQQTGIIASQVREAGYTRVFITGASGFIGQRLALALAKSGIEVFGLYRNTDAKSVLVEGGVKPVRGDIMQPEEWSSHLKGCDALFHLAALAAPWHPQPQMFFTLNYEGTKRVLQEAVKRDIKRIVFTSTAGTMGYRQHPEEAPIDESTFLSPPLETRYEKSKFQAENHATSLSNADEADVVIVNPSRVFGPGLISESNAITKIISWYLQGYWRIIPGDGSSIGNYVFIEDVVKGHMQALLHGRKGERYIIGGENADFDKLFDIIGEETGMDRWLAKLPVPLMLGVAQGEEWRAKWIGGRPLISVSFAQKYMRHFPLSIEKAERELNYRPKSLRESIRETIRWVKK